MSDNLTLDRMWKLLDLIDNPHQKLKVVHVAGTSGKTSTCYYIATLLHSSGKKVGMTVSPHVVSITERVQINNKPLSERKFCTYLEAFVGLVGDQAKKQSYFEFLIAFALWVFAQEKVDYAVVETGLGGLLDSTNVVTRADKVCVITDIGFDHQHILGDTLSEIASQKAGIIHEGNYVLSYTQIDEIMSVLKNKMRLKKATIQTVIQKNGVKYDVLPAYQKRNFTLAEATAEYIAKRDGFEVIQTDPGDAVIPGRMQQLNVAGRKIIFDGAHNPQKMHAFVSSVQTLYPNHKFDVVLAMRASKDFNTTIQELRPIAKRIICTSLGNNTEDHTVCIDPTLLQKACRKLGIDASIATHPSEGIENSTTNLTIVTGSLYFYKTFFKNDGR